MGNRRGRLIPEQDKTETIFLIREAHVAGSRLKPACALLELDIRTFQRWEKLSSLSDKRRGPITAPANKLRSEEKAHILSVVNSPEYRDQPPSQIVPNLADKDIYIGSESTMFRILKAEKMLKHRQASRPRKHKKPRELRATTPNQIWSWDITYLPSDIRGKYFYLYLFLDVFSRKIVGFDVFDEQSAENAKHVVSNACAAERIVKKQITLHSDNGTPMKGSLMLAKLKTLGVVPSFSRPSVSDDNPYSEALFRTLKYCPKYPSKPFGSVEEALAWVNEFVYWYNNIHKHSGIKFVSPCDRHENRDQEILEKRARVYELARSKNPDRWSGSIRNLQRPGVVELNCKSTKKAKKNNIAHESHMSLH